MNNIKDKLALMAPSLVFGEGEPLTVTVPAGQFRDVAKACGTIRRCGSTCCCA